MTHPTEVRTLAELAENAEALVREAREQRRTLIIAEDGKPGVVIIPAELMPRKLKAMQAACELAEV
jgi:hypothetical protein